MSNFWISFILISIQILILVYFGFSIKYRKYRIVKSGKDYYIQYKNFFLIWVWDTVDGDGMDFYNAYPDIEKAQEELRSLKNLYKKKRYKILDV
jgi:hypothetical protein